MTCRGTGLEVTDTRMEYVNILYHNHFSETERRTPANPSPSLLLAIRAGSCCLESRFAKWIKSFPLKGNQNEGVFADLPQDDYSPVFGRQSGIDGQATTKPGAQLNTSALAKDAEGGRSES